MILTVTGQMALYQKLQRGGANGWYGAGRNRGTGGAWNRIQRDEVSQFVQ